MFFFFVCVIKWQSSMRAFIQSISFFFFLSFTFYFGLTFLCFLSKELLKTWPAHFFFNVYFVQMNA